MTRLAMLTGHEKGHDGFPNRHKRRTRDIKGENATNPTAAQARKKKDGTGLWPLFRVRHLMFNLKAAAF
jgi:hypothetical protein